MIRIIATDLDGTLVSHQGDIIAANIAAVRAATDAGVRLVVATGRPSRWLGVLDAVATSHPLVIVSNGAAVYDLMHGRIVARHALARKVVEEIGTAVRSVVPDAIMALERGDLFGFEPGWLTDHTDLPDSFEAEWPELLDAVEPVVKQLVLHHGLSSEDLAAAIRPIIGERATVTHSLTHNRFGLLEISAPGVTKASALASLCDQWGVAANEVMAMGDALNDESMLEWAGRGIVMSTGHPGMQSRFESVDNSDGAGVARAVASALQA